MHQTVLIIDFGSKYTQVVARKVRELGVYSVILPCTAKAEAIKNAQPTAIILVGGAESVTDISTPKVNDIVFTEKIPVLGIGYGMQIIAEYFGATLQPANATAHAYVNTPVTLNTSSQLFAHMSAANIKTLMAYGDIVSQLPQDFVAIASSPNVPIVAIEDTKKRIYGVQFQIEDNITEHGIPILKNFLLNIAKLTADWNMQSFINRAVHEVKEKVGDKNVVLGLSGGIDSTVVAAVLHKALGKQLHCIFVDTGLMRHNEAEEVTTAFKKNMPGLNLYHVRAQEFFLGRLKNIANPEEKRKIIGHSFIEVFDEEAKKISNVGFLAQGTVYPDIIESYSAKGAVIKSHHNVGGLPETMKMQLIEPLRELFKDEVRAVGLELGLPHELVWRHPFPGPGLAIRVLGDVSEKRLNILRAADHILQQELRSSGWYDKIWQGFAILLPLQTVGTINETRTYENVIALRLVDSIDAMTADWSRVPNSLLSSVSQRIIKEVQGVNRVVLDISSKPPSTIEWE